MPELSPIGSLIFSLSPVDLHPPSGLQLTESDLDGWTVFDEPAGDFLSNHIIPDSEGGMAVLSYLRESLQYGIQATFKLDETGAYTLYVRVYLPLGQIRATGPRRARVRTLLGRVVQDAKTWAGECPPSPSTSRPFLDNSSHGRSLPEVYSSIPSPSPNPQYYSRNIRGMRSTLYPFQARSVSAMVSWELDRKTIPDPLYIPFIGMDNATYYLQPTLIAVTQECPLVPSLRGGILCEELGTGKTVMALALILATLHQLPEPEPHPTDPRGAMTPLSLRHFPECAVARERIIRDSHGRWKDPTRQERSQIPSLLEILFHYLRIKPEAWSHDEDQLQPGLACILALNDPFYLCFRTPQETAHSPRLQLDTGPKVMFLSAATLIIVPTNLFAQWASEILKHCDNKIRVYEVRTAKTIPSAHSLCSDYDIILMTQQQLSDVKHHDIPRLFNWKICKCPGFNGTRVPKCHCSYYPEVCPLFQVRWKRLIWDEGHNTANSQSNFAAYNKMLSVERRWVVTGTPTSNLLGLDFGQGSNLAFPEDAAAEDLSWQAAKSWSFHYSHDLPKLSKIFTHFLQVPQFAGSPSLFTESVSNPLLGKTGPSAGAIQVLEQLMGAHMIRHQVQDIETDLLLPLLNQHVVFLDLDPMALKTYNAHQAQYAINAIDSQRTGKDYLLNSDNQGLVTQAILNLSQVLFWNVYDENLKDLQGVLNEKGHLERAKSRGMPEEDLVLMQQSIMHLESALNDKTWIALQNKQFMPHYVANLPQPILEAWGGCSDFNSPLTLLDVQSLTALLTFIQNHPHASQQDIIDQGQLFTAQDALYFTLSKHPSPIMAPTPLNSSSPLINLHIGNSTSTKLDYIIDEIIQYSSTEKFLIFSSLPLTLSFISEALTLLGIAFLCPTGHETSKKMDKQAPHKRQTLIRAQMVTTFESSDLYRVFLMELQHGARGLNIVSASRVIFCEPVWKADVEAQAIKRVYRMGQKTHVTVKTLVIKDTFEETIVNRCEAIKPENRMVQKQADDWGRSDAIRNPKFLEQPEPTQRNNRLSLDFPIFQQFEPGARLVSSTGGSSSTQNAPYSETGNSESEPRQKRQKVRFAE